MNYDDGDIELNSIVLFYSVYVASFTEAFTI